MRIRHLRHHRGYFRGKYLILLILLAFPQTTMGNRNHLPPIPIFRGHGLQSEFDTPRVSVTVQGAKWFSYLVGQSIASNAKKRRNKLIRITSIIESRVIGSVTPRVVNFIVSEILSKKIIEELENFKNGLAASAGSSQVNAILEYLRVQTADTEFPDHFPLPPRKIKINSQKGTLQELEEKVTTALFLRPTRSRKIRKDLAMGIVGFLFSSSPDDLFKSPSWLIGLGGGLLPLVS